MGLIMNQIMDMLVQVAGIVVMAVAAAIAKALCEAYHSKLALLKADKKNGMLVDTIERIVASVEQQFSGAAGEEKFDEALRLANHYADKFGIQLDGDQMRVLIESAVHGIKQGSQAPPSLPYEAGAEQAQDAEVRNG